MKDAFSLQDKVAIVTGGNGGIGKAITRGMAAAGADLAIAARNETKTEEAVREIQEEFGTKAIGLKVDLQQEAQIHAMAAKVLKTFGRIDILINNAGTNIRKLPQDYTAAEWDEVLNTNLRGAFLCSQAVYPAMKSAGRGKVISIGSMTSLFGGAKVVLYGISKGGIVQMTRGLAVAWAPDNIQVNAILPGFINTDLSRQARKDVPELETQVISRTPVKRWGEPEEMAGAAVFLASQASDFITGVALPADGGYSIIL
ncbi:MAG: 2-deoxy-D-gluconate 3-dehydrogenase [Dehalococcoidales bacterium]|jgi:2-deoxy-D-gluconate 3-dehydrogenase|nr:2-deoxy-D-gluconate 3-dehydrogenase [Dehalococcoidales bacterium]MDP6576383.1 glucose 1-dehydrogenase [Dehalococcoidales bacterium]MDP6824839.1 glucose 1-dehydrogenase [Dehalococcoidales bacterium]